MIGVSICVEGQTGLTWPHWKRWVAMAERHGFAGLYRSDHFTMGMPPDEDSLETIVSLAYLADHTSRIRFGPLVAPVSFRDPVILARQAIALDDLSSGRMILGIGTGWIEREHTLFGYDLGDMNTRFARFEEALEVISQLLHNNEPVSYEGRFYQLREARLLPRPQRPGGPPILIGGSGPKRTLELAARYADIWNGTFMAPDVFRERSSRLDQLLLKYGRNPKDLKRTVAALCFFGHTEEVLARRVQRVREWDTELADASLEAVIQTLQTGWNAVAGDAEAIVAQIQAYHRVGVEELMLSWFDVDDVDGAEALAEHVLTRL